MPRNTSVIGLRNEIIDFIQGCNPEDLVDFYLSLFCDDIADICLDGDNVILKTWDDFNPFDDDLDIL